MDCFFTKTVCLIMNRPFVLGGLSVILVFAAFSACKKDPHDQDEQEQITRMILRFANADLPADMPVAVFSDPDGPGGNLPAIDDLTLNDSSVYNVEIVLLNDAVSPVDTISKEVRTEGHKHQFFYTASGADMSFSYSDQDKDGRPIGLRFALTTGAAGTGSLRVRLKHIHQGTKTGDPNVGDTDIDVSFATTIVQ